MTLENLESIGFIILEKTRKVELKNLFGQAGKKITDASVVGLSNESRMNFAYTVVLMCATTALRLMGYRVKSKQDYHYRTIETLRHTLKCSKEEVEYYHILREKRHQDIYSGEFIASDSEVNQALHEAEGMINAVLELINKKYPGLIE